MLPIFFFLSLGGVSFDLDHLPSLKAFPEESFVAFKKKYGRVYRGLKEETERRNAFLSTIEEISKMSQSNLFATFGVNQFSDYTPEMWERMKCGLASKQAQKTMFISKRPEQNTYWNGTCTACERFPVLESGLPIDPKTNMPGWDWVAAGAVTEVKSQGGCGGCWAFGAVGDVEGSHFLAGHDLVQLSVQQLLSCDHEGTDHGCGGSVSTLDTFEYIKKNGLTSWENYPFASANDTTPTCNTKKATQVVARISHQWQISGIGHLNDSYPNIPETFPHGSPWNTSVPLNETRVLEALVRTGPLSITINAEGLNSYKSGVLCPQPIGGCPMYCCYPENNSYSTLDHEVLLVGFGTEVKIHGNIDYWKVKNSWGAAWGEDGYFRVRRGKNQMGVACDVTHSVVQV